MFNRSMWLIKLKDGQAKIHVRFMIEHTPRSRFHAGQGWVLMIVLGSRETFSALSVPYSIIWRHRGPRVPLVSLSARKLPDEASG